MPEVLKNSPLVLGFDTHTGIHNFNLQIAACLTLSPIINPDIDTALAGEFDGITDKIGAYLGDA